MKEIPNNHLRCKKNLEIIGYVLYQLVSWICEPSTVSLLLYTFASKGHQHKDPVVMLNLGILVWREESLKIPTPTAPQKRQEINTWGDYHVFSTCKIYPTLKVDRTSSMYYSFEGLFPQLPFHK